MNTAKKIVYVDGFAIRNTLDDDFGIFHSYSNDISFFAPKFYIPENEIWVDHMYKNEVDFLQEIDLFFSSDSPLSYAEQRAEATVRFRPAGEPPSFVRKSETLNNLNIKYVDGAIVRKFFDAEFVLGGHHCVYDYVPDGEIWLDNRMDKKEIPYILRHEAVEYDLMKKGKSYDVAHEYATVVDKELRRADGVGCYPGDANYPWRNQTTLDIIHKHYVVS